MPIQFGLKTYGALGFCIENAILNPITARDYYPLPRMNKFIDSLGDSQVFSTRHANSGYWQIEFGQEYRDKTAFPSHYGLFRLSPTPFELENARETFQRVRDNILLTVEWHSALIYLEDIIILSKSPL